VATPETSFTLSVASKPIALGGYKIGHPAGQKVPDGCRLLLAVPDALHSLDVTGRRSDDLIHSDNLPLLLGLIERQRLWGKPVDVQLMATRGETVVARSNVASLACPVQPLSGPITPRRLGGLGDTGPKLKYTGNGTGRMLRLPAIQGKYYFKWGGKFETDDRMRGFDCTTFVGSVFGFPFDGHWPSNANGLTVATKLGAIPCNIEQRPGSEVKSFFASGPGGGRRGVFVTWSAGHVVLIIDGVVHEYGHSKNGYAETPIERWYNQGHWTVRQVPFSAAPGWVTG
jgi:hypothetical protein